MECVRPLLGKHVKLAVRIANVVMFIDHFSSDMVELYNTDL